jgi:hypothetical protein
MEFGKLTWTGLIIAAAGWIALILGATVSEDFWRTLPLIGELRPNLSVVGTSNSLIVSGLGLAILGALQKGFGVFQRFFEAVLQRSQRAEMQPAPIVKQSAKVQESEIAERGRVSGRSYVRLANGTVQIETLLGVRNFASFDEAREFIGS